MKASMWVERFERMLVFPVARGWFVLLAAIAVATFAVGVIVGGLGLVKLPVPEPDVPPEVEKPAPLNLAAVEAWLAAEKARKEAEEVERRSVRTARFEETTDTEGDPELDAAIAELRALFPEPPYAWLDVEERVCYYSTPYGCLSSGTKLKQRGVIRSVKEALRPLPDGRDEVIGALRLLAAVLKEAPVEKREELLAPTIRAELARRADYRSAVEDREAAIAAARAEWEAEVAALEAKKAMQRMYGIYGLMGGIGLLVLVSLFLAHFSIERQMRLLQGALERLAPGPQA